MAIKTLMVVIRVTGEYVSKKSTPSFCLKPLATSLALNFSMVPSVLSFFLKIYLHPIVLQPGGRWVKYQVLLVSMESISLVMASFQNEASTEIMASL